MTATPAARVHPLPCSRGDFTGIQPESRAGAASMTSSRQATASEERSGVFWKFQKSQTGIPAGWSGCLPSGRQSNGPIRVH